METQLGDTPVADYAGDPNFVPVNKKDQVNGGNYQPGNHHGFIPAHSKTDNYKVKQQGKPFDPPELTMLKFHDKNFNGVQDALEEDITTWDVTITDQLGVLSSEFTPVLVLTAEAGDCVIVESTPAGTEQTVSYLDGAQLSVYPSANPTVTVTVAGDCGETHEVVSGNVALGDVTACKHFDHNANGVVDSLSVYFFTRLRSFLTFSAYLLRSDSSDPIL